ncbi:MAG TPA: cytochrome c-type biogenesis protein [Thermodesulfobacteriota bacterium]
MRSLAASLLALVLVAAPAVGGASAAEPSAPVQPGSATSPPPTEAEARRVQEISAQLRCVVCQALSVADSPSTTAQQMRALVLEQVRAGKSDEEILAYFVSRYGEWVLLAPPRRGFNLLAWGLPFVGIGIGIVAVLLTARRWVRNGRTAMASSAESDAPSSEAGGTGSVPGGDEAGAPPRSAARDRLAEELARLRP